MLPGRTHEIDETRRLVEASAWRVALFEADLETTENFETWLASDARNAQAWNQVALTWARFDENAMEPELIIARRDALERARRQRQRRYGAGRFSIAARAIAASLLVVAILGGAAGFGAWQTTQEQTYKTALGERRTIQLADGSHVTLDSGTVVKVRLRPMTRSIELISGQARFDVAHDASRPFEVHARDKTVVATGTSFNVDLMGANLIVTLIEGRISILQDRGSDVPLVRTSPPPLILTRLTPGEQFVAPERKADPVQNLPQPVVLRQVNIDRTTAWETGQLIFDNEPLSSVAERVARYGDRPVIIEKDAAALRVSGVFDAGDLTTFVDAVQRVLPVTAETDEKGTIHLRRRDPRG